MRIKTSELVGAALDLSVAKAIGLAVFTLPKDNPDGKWQVQRRMYTGGPFWPSQDWSQCGPLIADEQIELIWNGVDGEAFFWMARHQELVELSIGDTPLIAACRAIVTAKIGEYVDVPDELCE